MRAVDYRAGVFTMRKAHVRKTTSQPREKDDFYRTPPGATLALLDVEKFPAKIWEPACGDGALSNILLGRGFEVVSTELIDRSYGETGRDFLLERELLAPAIITNPPFKLADEFVLHGLNLGAEKVAIFMRLAWLEGEERRKRLWSHRPPARIWVFSSRQTLWRGDDPEPKSTGGAIAFAWYVWERGVIRTPSVGWLTTGSTATAKKRDKSMLGKMSETERAAYSAGSTAADLNQERKAPINFRGREAAAWLLGYDNEKELHRRQFPLFGNETAEQMADPDGH